MKTIYKTHNELPLLLEIWGTSHQGEIKASYEDLIAIFGKPLEIFDDIKSGAEWKIYLNCQYFCEVYNYKNGKDYLGKEGTLLEDITEWNIAGFTPKCVEAVTNLIDEYIQYKGF
jgi:hypothetical protein